MHRPRAGTEISSCFRVRHPAGPSLSYLYRMPFEHRQRLHQIFAFLSSVLDLLLSPESEAGAFYRLESLAAVRFYVFCD